MKEVIFHNSGRKVQRLYEANSQVENVMFFYNGNSPTPEDEQDGFRTSRALANAMNKNKIDFNPLLKYFISIVTQI